MIQEYLIANTTEDALNKKRSNTKSVFFMLGGDGDKPSSLNR